MPLILSYFHNIIGPEVLYLTDKAKRFNESEIASIIKLLDTAEEGFFTMELQNLRTANVYFTINSPWARGRQEMLMISLIVQEQDPDLKYLEESLTDFVTMVKSFPDAYKACHFRNPPAGEAEAVAAAKAFLIEHVEDLSQEFQIHLVKTWGKLIPFTQLEHDRAVEIPPNLIRDFLAISEGEHRNCFFIYRKRADAIKIDMIPVTSDNVVKISIIFTEIAADVLARVARIFTSLDLRIIFTSGICQEDENCVYEVYVDSASVTSYDLIVEQIMQLKYAKKMKLKRINFVNLQLRRDSRTLTTVVAPPEAPTDDGPD